jgi:hypothetical protein
LRQGSYATPTGGLFPRAGQTWESCRTSPCGANERATITGGSQANIIVLDDGVDGGANVTFRNLTLSGSTLSAVNVVKVQNFTLDGLDISGWNSSNTDYEHGILLSYYGTPMQNFVVRNCRVHDPGSANVNSGAIAVGGPSSNGRIQHNTVHNAAMGIWFDVDAGNPNLGYTPHLVQGNKVSAISGVCYHIEHGSAWIMKKNIANGCGLEGIRIRPSGVGMRGHRYYNNTIYGASTNALWIPNETGDELFTDGKFKNNILINNSSKPAVNVGTPNHNDSTVIFQNNWIRNLGSGPGVCWGDASGDFSQSCERPGVAYANTAAGYSAWDTAASNVSGTKTGDPLFVNAAGGDFRLCEALGNPVPGCAGTSAAIDAGVYVGLPYNGAPPDLGAIESSGSGTAELPAPQNLRIVNP